MRKLAVRKSENLELNGMEIPIVVFSDNKRKRSDEKMSKIKVELFDMISGLKRMMKLQ